MKNNKILFTVVTVIMLLNIFIQGCAPQDDPLPGGNGGTSYKRALFPHEKDVKETDNWLVESGTCGYTVVYPSEGAGTAVKAAQEFAYFFEMATGITLPVISDVNESYSPHKRYFSIGKTKLFDEAGLTYDRQKLTTGGYIIKTKDLSVFMAGGYYGDLYAVYCYLESQFNFDIFAEDEILIDKNVSNCKLLDFNVYEIPDIEYNVIPYGMPRSQADRMRFIPLVEPMMSVNNLLAENSVDVYRPFHNFINYVPYELYGTDHQEWYTPVTYSHRQLKLDFTSDEQQNIVIEKMKETILANPNSENITFTQMDEPSGATEYTESLREVYGDAAFTAEYIHYTNIVARAIKEWLAETAPERTVNIIIYAYWDTLEAPVKKDASGKYVPIDESVVPEDNVTVWVVGGGELDPTIKLSKTDQAFEKWSAICPRLWFWTNSSMTFFMYYWMPFPSIAKLQDDYKSCYQNNVRYAFMAGQDNERVPTDWGKLKTYLASKLGWNAYQDAEKLTDKFFANYFREAARPMREFYEDQRKWIAYKDQVLGGGGTPDPSERTPKNEYLLGEQFWPQSRIWAWLGKIDEAYAAIERHKVTDPQLYKKLHERITMESVSPRMLEYIIYSYDYTRERGEQMLNSLIDDTLAIGMTRYSARVPYSTFFGI